METMRNKDRYRQENPIENIHDVLPNNYGREKCHVKPEKSIPEKLRHFCHGRTRSGDSLHRTPMTRLLILAIFILAHSLPANAITNGGFETGDFAGWSTIGDTLVVNGSFGVIPAAGTYQALTSNGPGGLFGQFQGSYSGNNSVDATSLVNNPLDAFLGLPLGSLSQLANGIGLVVAIEGSAIKQSFTGTAGTILSFNWNYLTDEGAHFDFAFVVLDGALSLLADNATAHPGSGTLFFYESGYQTFATTLTSSGTHQLAIGVVDTGDPAVNSGVLVDNVSIGKVPESASWLLFGVGLIALAVTLQHGSKTQGPVR
jgi:hypothetical protein